MIFQMTNYEPVLLSICQDLDSVFEIDNSKRIVDNIVNDLTNTFEKRFSQSDSVYIFKLSSSCEVLRYGYAKNEENDFFIIT